MQDEEKQAVGIAKEEEDHVSKKLNKWKIGAGILVLLFTLFTGILGKLTDAIANRIQGEVAKVEDAQRVIKVFEQQKEVLERLGKIDSKLIDLQQQITLLQKEGLINAQQAELATKRMDSIQAENDLGKEERLILRGQVVTIEKADAVQTQIITSTLGNLIKEK
jgi:hypothetical protein